MVSIGAFSIPLSVRGKRFLDLFAGTEWGWGGGQEGRGASEVFFVEEIDPRVVREISKEGYLMPRF